MGETRNAHIISTGKPLGKRHYGRWRRRIVLSEDPFLMAGFDISGVEPSGPAINSVRVWSFSGPLFVQRHIMHGTKKLLRV
jgi:hypothetical protein